MRLFIFAIGGTGSRVLKSLVMLSAAGVRPLDANGKPVQNLELVPIIIDPHKNNADLKRAETLLNAYREIRAKLYGNALNADGSPNTAHSLNPVPFIYVTENKNARVTNGVLADVAPSLLHIMGLPQPAEMTGRNLIED